MDGLELFALRRSNASLARRLEIIESILERSGLIDQVLDPGVVVDPAPGDFGRRPYADPVPWDINRFVGREIAIANGGWRIPQPADPATFDLSRLTKVQLEFALHSIEADRTRLAATEQLIKDQIKEQTASAGASAKRA